MIISSCPRCGDPYRITDLNLSGSTLVQCPWCGDQFPHARVVSLPPELIMVDAGRDQQPLDRTLFRYGPRNQFSGLVIKLDSSSRHKFRGSESANIAE